MKRFQATNIFFLMESYERMEEQAKKESRDATFVSEIMGAFSVFSTTVISIMSLTSGLTWTSVFILMLAFTCFFIFNSISEHYFEKAINIERQFSQKQKEAYIESLHLIYGKEMQ